MVTHVFYQTFPAFKAITWQKTLNVMSRYVAPVTRILLTVLIDKFDGTNILAYADLVNFFLRRENYIDLKIVNFTLLLCNITATTNPPRVIYVAIFEPDCTVC